MIMTNSNLFSKRVLVIVISALLALMTAMPMASGQSPSTGQSTNGNEDQEIKVMTYNLYLGAHLDTVAKAAASGDQTALIRAVTNAWNNVVATNFPERADALAKEIQQSQPELINLQEVSRYSTADYPNHPSDVTDLDPNPADGSDVQYNYLNLLLDALKNRGLNYTPVVINKNYDVELPRRDSSSPTGLENIRMVDRDVILARADVPVSAVGQGDFENNLSFPIKVTRGWASVDITVGGKASRLINTHLDPDDLTTNIKQGNEILHGPADTPLPVILAGDLNSLPDAPPPTTYKNMIGAGFTDAWSATHPHPKQLGNTCCHVENLRDTTALSQRPDLVLLHGSLRAFDAKVIGGKRSDRTSSGLWPSDHAGVVATLGGQNDQGEQ